MARKTNKITKSLFIKDTIRKIVEIKNNDQIIEFKIYNYNETSKSAILSMYETKQKQGLDKFDLTKEELRIVLNMFTDCLFTLDELSEILDNPSVYFDVILGEIQLLLSEMVLLYIQEQKQKLVELQIQEVLLDTQQEVASNALKNGE